MEKGAEKVLDLFARINAIPRCSGNEAELREWIAAWAGGLGLSSRADTRGNLVIKVPASPGFESSPTVILQGHMDMVCEKSPGSRHNFDRDPIRLKHNGDWIHADGTTLGADNGIGLALAMAVAHSQDRPRPPLELLFTVEEEIGLAGALNLDANMISGNILLNLDSDREAEFTIGCAGGRGTIIEFPLKLSPPDNGGRSITISAAGMKGGHSGIDIHRNRANAIRVLARILRPLRPFKLVEIHGGTAMNVIPREARATIIRDPGGAGRAREASGAVLETITGAYAATDPGLDLTFEDNAAGSEISALSQKESSMVVDMLLAVPNGVIAMDSEMEGTVETSCNLARVDWGKSAMRLEISQRSSRVPRLNELTAGIEAAAALAGCQAETDMGYPPWPPRHDSPLLERSRKLHETLFGARPRTRVIHAGLECGVIGSLRPGIQMISFGPTIENPHSPAERLHGPSLERTLLFMTELLRSLAEAPLPRAPGHRRNGSGDTLSPGSI